MNKGPQWNAQSYDKFGRFVSDHGKIILKWLDAQPDERILDAGCGDGALTCQIAKQGAHVEGIEQAPSMAKAAQAHGLQVRTMDLCDLEDVSQFDAIFSNAVLHWIEDWPQLLHGFHRALKPNGRLVVECGGFGNIAAIRTAIIAVAGQYNMPIEAGPETYLTDQDAQTLLQKAGFKLIKSELCPRQTHLPNGMAGWLRVFRDPFFKQFEQGSVRDKIIDQVLTMLEGQLKTPNEQWFADYVRLRFIAQKI